MMKPLLLGVAFLILMGVIKSLFEVTLLAAFIIALCISFAPAFIKGFREGKKEDSPQETSDQE
jgi:hypothetical protein